nr:MAG TPA: Sporulation protein Cse60 [Bacteriophage sp.]
MMKGIKRIVNIEEGISLLLAKVINDFLNKNLKSYEEEYLKDNEYVIDIKFEKGATEVEPGYQTMYTAFILIGEKND